MENSTKKFIKVENDGIIDSEAFNMIGASTKRDDSTKIGFFGSGLKYSIAYLLRNKIKFKVYADYREITFETKVSTLRGQSFDVIYINGEKTSMTTEMGIDWKAWFAIREIYCNAIDEGGAKISIVKAKNVVPIEDKTVFYIQIDEEFQKLIDEWMYYFSEERKDCLWSDDDNNKIFSGSQNLIVYRKGIRVLSYDDCKCIFNYDIDKVAINESRVISDEYSFKWELKKMLQKNSDLGIITTIYNRILGSWEKDLYWNYNHEFFHENWLKPIEDKTLVPYENAGYWSEELKAAPTMFVILPHSLIEGLKARFNDAVKIIGEVGEIKNMGEFKIVESLNKKQELLLNDSIKWLEANNYIVKYPISIVDFFKKNRLGQAKDGNILLSEKLFDMGKKNIVATIIEEQEHLETGFADESREFQNHFINKYISAMEDKSNLYL